ncbi:MAG: hypothetical protein OEQ13_05905 [Acidobacteriota bacterium]|nr:hypothetical protein [Acidobacteriota bacterium]
MKSIELNLASRPYRNDTPVALLLGLLLVAALAFTAHNTYAYLTTDVSEKTLLGGLSDHRTRMQEIRTEADRLREKLDGIDVQTLESQASFVSAVMQERNFSWTRLFNELEAVVPWNIRLSSIRPGFQQGGVHVDFLGTAQDVTAFFDFQETVEASPRFSGVLPTQYEVDETTRLVTFKLQARYLPEPRRIEAQEADASPEAAEDAPARVLVVPEQPAPARAGNESAPAVDRPRGERRRKAASSSPRDTAPAAAPSSTPVPAADALAAKVEAATGGAAGAGGTTAASRDAASAQLAEPSTPQPGQHAGRTVGIPPVAVDPAPPPREVVRRPAGDVGETADRQPLDPNNPLNPTQVEFDEAGRLKRIVPRVNPDRPVPPRTPPPGAGGKEQGSEGESGDEGSGDSDDGGGAE